MKRLLTIIFLLLETGTDIITVTYTAPEASGGGGLQVGRGGVRIN